MVDLTSRQGREALDRHITGNYGESQYRRDVFDVKCEHCGLINQVSDQELDEGATCDRCSYILH